MPGHRYITLAIQYVLAAIRYTARYVLAVVQYVLASLQNTVRYVLVVVQYVLAAIRYTARFVPVTVRYTLHTRHVLPVVQYVLSPTGYTLRNVAKARRYYVERFKRVQEATERTSNERAEVWATFARDMRAQWKIFAAMATVYEGSIIGLLSVPGSRVTLCIGILGIVASIFTILYCGFYNAYMPAESEKWRGLDLKQNSTRVPNSSWRWPPRLLIVPACWMICATTSFIAYILATLWMKPDGASEEVQHSNACTVLAALGTCTALSGSIQVAFIVPAFARLAHQSERTSDEDA